MFHAGHALDAVLRRQGRVGITLYLRLGGSFALPVRDERLGGRFGGVCVPLLCQQWWSGEGERGALLPEQWHTA